MQRGDGGCNGTNFGKGMEQEKKSEMYMATGMVALCVGGFSRSPSPRCYDALDHDAEGKWEKEKIIERDAPRLGAFAVVQYHGFCLCQVGFMAFSGFTGSSILTSTECFQLFVHSKLQFPYDAVVML